MNEQIIGKETMVICGGCGKETNVANEKVSDFMKQPCGCPDVYKKGRMWC